jgi:hypothetical protein
VAAASPLISYLWIGHMTSVFIRFTVVLSACWFANLVAAPAYLLGVASGRIWWNLAGHIVATGGAFLAAYALGRLFGATGVAVGGGAMLAIGSLLSMIMNCRMLGIRALPDVEDFRQLASRSASFLKTRYANFARR